MLKNLVVKLSALALLSVLAACVTSSDIGKKSEEISEAESDLVFYGPGLEGGFRRIITGMNGPRARQTFAMYGPKKGKTPYANIVMLHVGSLNYYFKKQSIEKTVAIWAQNENNPPSIVDEGYVVNKLGKALYATYMEGGEACVAFILNYGGSEANSLAGNRKMTGHYCDKRTSNFSHEEVTRILKTLGDKNVKYPEPPIGWVAASSAAAGSASSLSGLTKLSLLLSFEWDNGSIVENIRADLSKGQLAGNTIVAPFHFENLKTGKCDGNLKLTKNAFDTKAKSISGKWEIDCAQKITRGSFTIGESIMEDFLAELSTEEIAKVQQVTFGSGTGVGDDKKIVIITIATDEPSLLREFKEGAEKISRITQQDILNAQILIDFDWEGIGEIKNIPVVSENSSSTFKFEHPALGTCSGYGSFPRVGSLIGNWNMWCTNAKVEGSYTLQKDAAKTLRKKQGKVFATGKGKDEKDQVVLLTLSAS